MNSLNQCTTLLRAVPVISHAGLGAMLVNVADGAFDLTLQYQVWAMARKLMERRSEGIDEVVPGVNNLLVMFDPLTLHPRDAERLLLDCWSNADGAGIQGREIEIPVIYGGAAGEDLPWLAQSAGLDIANWVGIHAQASYSVACVGSMPGFAYLAGLSEDLATPRRATPRMSLPKGSVIIGGEQAGVMPCTAPSGWHVVGRTEVDLFDPSREQPCLLMPGDRVRFVCRGIEA
ncbi:5-oxoprolinase subunit PxpB [Pseudomonas sp. BN414]|uniref:5-oxoprolinase subunit PxpB n=1 Tax=Pseudomonas sp. BN414 TaxID=2567888 RepID=UPI0024555028|nr:5-oxoprolinase subunit PxpB [Pseudomonas sp. BN414]MDH4567057.1 5-oxoprolinase subunit PxpB [Pseudomonas sp. BN414]